MSVTETILEIEKQLSTYNHLVTNAKQTVLDSDVTRYPIFVASRSKVELGISFIDHEKTTALWSINVSSLEEFVAKNIIDPSKVDNFKQTFKDVDNYNCYFIISSIGNQFAYLPSVLK